MKVVRVIKWIAIVVCIAALALNVAANVFMTADVLSVAKASGSDKVYSYDRFAPSVNELRVSDIKKELADLSYSFDNVKALLKPYGDTAKPAPVEQPAPVAEPTAVPHVEEPTAAPVEVTEPEATTDNEGASSSGSMNYKSYNVKDHSNLVFGVMKYGSASAEFGWLTKPLGLENVSINISFFVGLVALFIAIVTRIISKHYKTVYGTILMTLGLLIFFCAIVGGVFASEKILVLLSFMETTDCALVQFCTVAFCGIVGGLIGLPIYSCGIRQMTCKRLRRRLRRKSK